MAILPKGPPKGLPALRRHAAPGYYDRKPRGGSQWTLRFSFCCDQEGCRRRHTPPSVRFHGAAGLCRAGGGAGVGNGPRAKAPTGAALREAWGSTAARWSGGGNGGWAPFVDSSFWKEARARFMPPLCHNTMPLSLCEALRSSGATAYWTCSNFCLPSPPQSLERAG